MQQRKAVAHAVPTKKQTPTERAAIVIGMLVSEDPRIAEQILRSLDPRAVARIFSALKKLPALDGDTVDQVLGEFLELVKVPTHPRFPASQRNAFLERLEQKILGPRTGRDSATDKETERRKEEWQAAEHLVHLQDLLERIDAQMLLKFARTENSKVVALALSLTPSATAAQVLRQLPTEQATELVLAISQLEEVSAAAIEALVEGLEELVAESEKRLSLGRDGEDGTAKVVALLAALEPARREALIEKLAGMPESAPQKLAETVRRSMVTLEHLAKLLPRDLNLVLAPLPDPTLALALVNVTETVSKPLLAALSSRRREAVQEELALLEPQRGRLRLSDVLAAQEAIVNHALKLKASNSILFPWEEELI